MAQSETNVVICGAGIAGISAAYHLAVKQQVRNVILVDERAPLTLTSDKSTECYRNWWPGPGDAMVRLMDRSIDLMEALAQETGNGFHLNRRGYLYATADPARIASLQSAAEEADQLGAGPARYHTGQAGDPPYLPAPPQGFEDQPTGSDLILDTALIRAHFPYLSERVVAVLHARRCGWLSAQQLGVTLLEKARAGGARFLRARVEGVETQGGRVQAVHISDGSAVQTLAADVFVNAAGPLVGDVARMVGVTLPVFSELHAKVYLKEERGVVPREAPLLIWADPQRLLWSEEEQALLAESEETRRLLETFPPGVHARPEGGAQSTGLLLLWPYHTPPVEPVWPPEIDPLYTEIVLRGMSTMLPGLRDYLDRAARPVVDGGYYTKTRENRPLIGPLPTPGAYVIGALSGYGVMAACAAGELLAAYVTGAALPSYAPAFAPERYADPAYQALLENWDDTGQL